MIKKILRIFVVIVFAWFVGILFYTQTNIGKEIIDTRIDELKNTSLIVEKETGIVVDSATPRDPLQIQTGNTDTLLQKRLQYYKASKKELWVK